MGDGSRHGRSAYRPGPTAQRLRPVDSEPTDQELATGHALAKRRRRRAGVAGLTAAHILSSTHDVALYEVFVRRTAWAGWGASIGPSWSMIRSAAGFAPHNRSSWRSFKLVRRYTATSSTWSLSGMLRGQPLRTSSAPSYRSCATSLLKLRGLSPGSGAIPNGRDTVITPPTAGASHGSRRGWPVDHLLDMRRLPDQVSHRTRPESKVISSAIRPAPGTRSSLTASTVSPR